MPNNNVSRLKTISILVKKGRARRASAGSSTPISFNPTVRTKRSISPSQQPSISSSARRNTRRIARRSPLVSATTDETPNGTLRIDASSRECRARAPVNFVAARRKARVAQTDRDIERARARANRPVASIARKSSASAEFRRLLALYSPPRHSRGLSRARAPTSDDHLSR